MSGNIRAINTSIIINIDIIIIHKNNLTTASKEHCNVHNISTIFCHFECEIQ